jgi:hypothetical protein
MSGDSSSEESLGSRWLWARVRTILLRLACCLYWEEFGPSHAVWSTSCFQTQWAGVVEIPEQEAGNATRTSDTYVTQGLRELSDFLEGQIEGDRPEP